jgi:hypothetical protein
MMNLRRITRIALLLATPLLAGGCAASFGGTSFGPGLHLGLDLGRAPGLTARPATCLLQGSANGMSGAGPAATAGAMKQKAAQLQARYMLGASSPAARMESWKHLASGGC